MRPIKARKRTSFFFRHKNERKEVHLFLGNWCGRNGGGGGAKISPSLWERGDPPTNESTRMEADAGEESPPEMNLLGAGRVHGGVGGRGVRVLRFVRLADEKKRKKEEKARKKTARSMGGRSARDHADGSRSIPARTLG